MIINELTSIIERLEPYIASLHQTIEEQAQEIERLLTQLRSIPRIQGPVRSKKRNLMEEMQPGETIFLPDTERKATAKLTTCIQTRDRLLQLPLRRFTSRTVTEDGIEGVRIWRLA